MEEISKLKKGEEFLSPLSSGVLVKTELKEHGEILMAVGANVMVKKKISDADLSLACNEAKGRQLLFLSNGELTKKALEFIEREKEIVIFNRI